ncbi:ATP-binding protein, partial [Leptospira santarosai]|nr:ATP-binding protein [Leptospira santarosai]
LYHILRTRLFEEIASEEEIHDIALSYKEAVKETKQMNYSNYNPDSVYAGIKDAYPFHPSIKDLFARFKENSGFQQTRGFIRLTRMMIKKFV